MKEAYWGYWLIILGIFIVVIMLLIQNITSNNSEDFYNVRQINEAAMVSAVDYAYYREYGELRINKEKFMENFLRMFAESASLTSEYDVTFAAIYEAPPKASVEIVSSTDTYIIASDSTDFDLSSRVDAVLEQGIGKNANVSSSSNSSNTNSNNGSNTNNDSNNTSNDNNSNNNTSTITPTEAKEECKLEGVNTIYFFMNSNEMSSKYYNCYKDARLSDGSCKCDEGFKPEYLNDIQKAASSLTADFVKKMNNKNVSCSDSEKQTVENKFKEYLQSQRVPDISSAMVGGWAKRKYYSCNNTQSPTSLGYFCGTCDNMSLKKEYYCNPNKFPEIFLNDWEKEIGVTLSTSERNQILEKVKNYVKNWDQSKCN